MGTRRPRAVWHTAAGTIVAVYLLAAAIVVAAHQAVPVPEWLALHLLVLGAATNAVFVWSRFFAQALLHARPGAERPAHLRLGVLNTGVVAVLSGISSGLAPVAVAGAALVVSAVLAHVASLLVMARSSPLAGPLAVVACITSRPELHWPPVARLAGSWRPARCARLAWTPPWCWRTRR